MADRTDMISTSPFESRTATLTGSILLHAPIEDAFPLFSPLGERQWVAGWNPEILSPRGADWAEGMVFRTVSEGRQVTWVVAHLDRQAHRVVYYRTEPGLVVARVEVRCQPVGDRRTRVATQYDYVGLSEAGNDHVAEWTDAAYAAKMAGWESTINEVLRRTPR